MSPDRTKSPSTPPRRRHHIGGLIALAALAVVATFWVWTTYLTSVSVPLFGWQNGVIVGGLGVFCTALLSELRALSFDDLLEWAWIGIAALLALVVGIFWGIMALFGWD